MMNISIIIINYNTFDLTSQCIRSINKFTIGVDFEIILVDNASKERNPDDFLNEFPNITLVKSTKNLGFAGGNNLGISYAKANYILLLNSDTYLIENSIYNSLKKYQELEPKVGALTIKLIYPNGVIQGNAQPFPSILKTYAEKLRLHKLLPHKIRYQWLQGFYWDYNQSGYVDWVWGTYFLFKKSLLDKLKNHKLDEQFFMYAEDIKWCFDFDKLGHPSYYYSDTKLIHINGGSHREDKNDLIKSNVNHFIKDNFSIIKYWILKK